MQEVKKSKSLKGAQIGVLKNPSPSARMFSIPLFCTALAAPES
jgi:hypothetical protein